MATTSSIRVAGKAAAGPGGDGTGGRSGRVGLRAKLAAGVAILGCAAALAFGGLRLGGDLSSSSAAPAVPVAQATIVDQREQQRFLEQNRTMPDGAQLVAPGMVGTLSGGSYADTIWELENVVGERVNAPAATVGTLSGGSYQDLIWELEVAVGERVNTPAATAK